MPHHELRGRIRAQRRHASAHFGDHAVQALSKTVSELRIFQSAQHIAAYLAFDGEMDPAALVARALGMGKHVYLPVMTGNPYTLLRFAPYRPGCAMRPNRFGIPEPDVTPDQLIDAHALDLVLTPLVAFDLNGHRMGMGGGYYDRTFAFRLLPEHLPKPRLLGIAYETQKVEALERQEWDVPLDGVATEAAFYPAGPHAVS